MFNGAVFNTKINLKVMLYNLSKTNCIKSEQEARKIGEDIVHILYEGIVDFNAYVISIEEDEDEWIVSFDPPPIPPEKTEYGLVKRTVHLGGDGPEIHLDKATGKIIHWGLQK